MRHENSASSTLLASSLPPPRPNPGTPRGDGPLDDRCSVKTIVPSEAGLPVETDSGGALGSCHCCGGREGGIGAREDQGVIRTVKLRVKALLKNEACSV